MPPSSPDDPEARQGPACRVHELLPERPPRSGSSAGPSRRVGLLLAMVVAALLASTLIIELLKKPAVRPRRLGPALLLRAIARERSTLNRDAEGPGLPQVTPRPPTPCGAHGLHRPAGPARLVAVRAEVRSLGVQRVAARTVRRSSPSTPTGRHSRPDRELRTVCDSPARPRCPASSRECAATSGSHRVGQGYGGERHYTHRGCIPTASTCAGTVASRWPRCTESLGFVSRESVASQSGTPATAGELDRI